MSTLTYTEVMTSATRTDVHSPKNLVTEDYEFVACFDNAGPDGQGGGGLWFDTKRELLDFLVSSSPLRNRGLYQCHHCGARFRYFAVVLHTPTGEHLAIGETCLENRFRRATVEFQRLRKAAELERAKQAVKGAVEAFVQANPDLVFMADKDHEHTNSFVADVARKLRKYGSLSEKQTDAVRASVARDAEKAAAKAAEPTSPVPTGNGVVIEGTLLYTKLQQSYMGGDTLKMLVKGDGWKVWGTVPASLDAEVGDTVRFVANVEAKDGDPSFGFFKRPRKAEMVRHAA